MISVFGELPRSITLPQIDEDKALYLMFEGIDNPHDICKFLPSMTYIITDKSATEIGKLNELEFYNVMPGVKYADLTVDLIMNFLSVPYDINKGVCSARLLREHYARIKPTYDALMTILLSLKNRDVSGFYDAVKYNLSPVIAKLNDIRQLLQYSNNVDTIQQRFAELDNQLEELRGQVGVSNEEAVKVAAQEIEKLQAELKRKVQEVGLLEDEKSELVNKVNELMSATQDSVARSSYDTLLNDKKLTDQQYAALQIEVSNLRAKLKAVENLPKANLATDEFSKDGLIESLQKEIELFKSVTPAERIYGMLPIITNNVMLRAQYVLQLKEIKPAIYIDSLIGWTTLLLKSRYIRERGLHPIIVIFDNLIDQFRLAKYKKHGFCINTEPKGAQFVVVTNDCNLMFLKNVVEIQRYDFVMIIDRLGSARCVADSDKTVTYYLTDSPEDVTDFKLPADSCIMFNSDRADGCAYHLEPDGSVAAIRGDKRWARMGQNKIIDNILKGLNVLEDAR